jgi:hypothetical protein
MVGTEDGRTKEALGIFGPYYTILYGKYKTSERRCFHPLPARSTVPLGLFLKIYPSQALGLEF